MAEFKFDVNAVLFMLYLQYKGNMISRDNLKALMKIIKDTKDLDIAKFLAEEVAKAIA